MRSGDSKSPCAKGEGSKAEKEAMGGTPIAYFSADMRMGMPWR
jgi:hypothetical protein